MHRLSSPIEEIQPRYDVVVIGSGYGGAIAASRLARAGQQVCLIEKGREFIPGEFPDTSSKVLAETQIDTPKAHLGARSSLYDMRMNDHINVFKGCGLGGTSLVNANVSLAADPRAIDHSSWPQAFRDDIGTKLREGAERALEMLKATPYQDDDYEPLEKLQALKDSASVLEGKFYRPPINVNFVDGTNHVGVEQHACTRCGDCLTGCNYSAKNTLMMNYLPDAVNHGAQIFTQIDVRRLERENASWVIHYQLLDSGREGFKAPTMTIRADLVILAAGSLGSTEILLRSGGAGLALSKRVGKGFTGNGDFLAFSYNSDREINGVGHGHRPPEGREAVGPTITGVIDSRESGALEDGLIIEEGSLAGGFADLLPLGLSSAAKLFGKDTDLGDSVQESLRELESLVQGPYHGAIDNTQTYLVMAHDDAQGEMKLEDDRLRINWPGVGEQQIFTTISERLHQATKPLGGTYVRNPAWSESTDHNLTTVHPLGGCGMAEDAARGVVNHRGQVFLGEQGDAVYENLYVSDGSVVPRALGVNPLLTISALTERCCALIAEDRAWTINYSLPSERPPEPPRLHTLGIRFTETMKGFLSTEETSDFENAFRRGQADDSPFQFILTIISDNLEAMIQEPEHQARAIGTVVAPALSPEPLTVTQGVFQLLIEDPEHPDTRLMKYSMKMTSEQGRTFFFYGFKVVRNDPGPDLWKDTTTLYITVFDGDGTDSPVIGKGILDIKPQDFMIQMTTMQVTYAKDDAERLKAVVDFGNFFNRQLFEVYGGVLAKKSAFDSHPLPRVKRPLRMAAPELHLFQTEDGVTLKLTRYRGGGKGPVMLSPGFGTSSLAFSIDTIETNLPEYLYAHGYDVWLLDYRASPELASASTQFTLDDIATKDYPAAVDKVLAETGAGDVQMLVHCVGSMTFIMSMLAGKLEGKIRSAICSQLAFYPLSPPLNEFRAGTRIASVLSALGVDTLTTDFDNSNWLDRLTDAVLNIYPTRGRFKSPTERRIQLLYGEVYKHDNLNAATHAAMHEVFGEANLASFQHIAMLVRKGKILNAEGKDVYLPHVERLAAIPITLIHGAQNHLFLPEGSRQTLRTLCARNDATFYQMITYPTYAHMDFFIGENAATDIFPDLVAQLNVFNQPRRHTIAVGAGAGGPMSDGDTGARPAPSPDGHTHPGLKQLFSYPLLSAITERRTRRVARGVSIDAAGLSHQSANQPEPLSKLEEAVLIVSTGITGVTQHDGPLRTAGGGKELGTPFINVLGRAASSPDNAQATSFFMINDEGVWLLKSLKGRAGLAVLKDFPPHRQDWTSADWIAAAAAVKVHLYPRRLEFPRRFPYYHVWNKQLSNIPGTTLLMPIVDCTRGMLNIMLNLLSEPDGERPTFVDDWRKFRPKSLTEFGAWVASGLGLLGRKIPYQPAGGIEWARSGFTNPDIVAPLGIGHAWRLDYEAVLHLQNLMLLGQAMGLGAWIHASIFPPYIFERDEAKGMLGLGFRMHEPKKKWRTWPPVPAPLPNPVGIDGVLEALCPPYVSSMDEMVDRMLEEKYGAEGAYGEKEIFAMSYNSPERAKEFLDNAEPYSPKAIQYLKDICNYIYDTYGRFPAHVDAFHLPGVWVQFSHLEIEYYEKFYDPKQFRECPNRS